ncbi:MAG TPA: hypothetical protein VH394_09795 [Thermoanaerobaculia bacterium]|nr:hypothetical protein [Thermoanaerobaculia bacterium]
MSRRSMAMALVPTLTCLLLSACASSGGGGGTTTGGDLILGAPGVAVEDDTLLVAAQLRNPDAKSPVRVTVDSVELDSTSPLTDTPIDVGEIPADGVAVIQASFKAGSLIPGKEYRLAVRGTLRDARGRSQAFTAATIVVLPPVDSGSGQARSVTVKPNKTSGAPYPPQRPSFDNEVNGSRWTVPTGRFVPGEPTRTQTTLEKVVLGDPPAIVFNINNGVGITTGSTVAEPSGGATGRDVVFVTSNWFAAYATDGGTAFTSLNPTTIFPADAIGFCCDQIVQYVPNIDRFIWLLQGNNGFRLASASRADIISSGGTAWTYWNLPSDLFGQPNGTGVDYPDLSVGNNSLYLSWDVGWPACPANCRSGFQVSRISLADIQAGGTITIFYTNPPDSSMCWGGHLTQNTLDEIFWAGHNSNSQMRVFSWQEGSGTYFWRNVNISTWANNALSSTTPDGQNWLTGSGGFPGNAVIGSTRVRNQIWFAWNAGTDRSFRQPHVEMVSLDRGNNFNRLQQVQVWNESYAFAYPSLATNICTQEVGLSFEFGGGGNYENHVVGFWGDFVAYITTGSTVGTTRFGDYVTLRQTPRTGENPGNLFSAFGYGLNPSPDLHYVVFGRPPASTTCKGQ